MKNIRKLLISQLKSCYGQKCMSKTIDFWFQQSHGRLQILISPTHYSNITQKKKKKKAIVFSSFVNTNPSNLDRNLVFLF